MAATEAERVDAAGHALSYHPRRPGKVSQAKRRALAEFVTNTFNLPSLVQ
jgi:hypothetical protein